MRRYLNSVIFILLALLPTTALAHDFEVDGIYYNIINDNEVEVTFTEVNKYSGEVDIPEIVPYEGTLYSVTSIGNCAFCDCTDLSGIIIPNSVLSIGESAFYGCRGLTNVTIGNSVISIGFFAFKDCRSLKTLTIPNSVTHIGPLAFSGCRSLRCITLGNSVTLIEGDAFEYCYNLSYFYCLALTPPTIYPNTFSDGPSGSLYVPKEAVNLYKEANYWNIFNIQSIGPGNFFIDKGLEYRVMSEDEVSVIHNWRGDTVTIPSTVNLCGRTFFVTAIGDNAFRESGLCSVTIPNTVTSIGDFAFNCNLLTSITIPNSVKYIGENAFGECDLTSIVVENGNTSYDSRENCNAIIETSSNTLITGCMNTVIPNSVRYIGDDAFFSCRGLTSITIPDSVISIGCSAFWECSSISNLHISNSVTSIGEYAFYGCGDLNSLIIPNSVTSIGEWAFYCRGLANVTCLATPPPTIYSNTFSDLVASQVALVVPIESLETYQAADYWKEFSQIIVLDFEKNDIYYRALNGNEVKVIKRPGEDNFYQGDMVIPETVTYEGYTFTVTAIDEGAFEDCYELTSVVIGDAVESIGENAFQGCTGLTSVTIGSGVTTIGAKAFNYCNALQTVTCKGSMPPVMENSNCFSNAAYSRAVLRVPRQAVETYANADYWYKFNSIEGFGSIGVGDVNADGSINISDVTTLISIVLKKSDVYIADGDLNNNGMLDIGDVTSLIVIVLYQGLGQY